MENSLINETNDDISLPKFKDQRYETIKNKEKIPNKVQIGDREELVWILILEEGPL